MAQPLHRRLRTGLFYALRTAFRITPMPEATRDKLRQRFLDRYSSLIPPGPKGQVAEGTRVRRPYVRSDERAIGYVPYSKGELPDPLPATLVAFYLPQFHTIPENDEWWGKGFTEWRNVTRALPQFEGHHQPKLPGDLGFYDLRNVEVMHEQARLAREYGISAFCFYFYWFGGKTLLETPLRNWLADPTIDLQFCLCWANEKWTRTWDGRGDEILIDQKHSPEDDIAFIEHVAEYMRDPRYLRVDGKPMLLVYRPGLFPDIAATAERWREWCLKNGIGEIHLAYVQSFERPIPANISFDAAVEFPPNLSDSAPLTAQHRIINALHAGRVFDWREMARHFTYSKAPSYRLYPGVNCGWDNEPRRPGKGRTYFHSSPRGYRDWLANAIEKQFKRPQNLVFINAWNEWAEGAILEPQAALGYAYLDQTRKALLRADQAQHAKMQACIVLHAWFLDELDELLESLASLRDIRLVVTTTNEKYSAVHKICLSHNMNPEFFIVDNRGRDILPFLQITSKLLDEGVDLVLKLHTKRSPHITSGTRWRQELIAGITGTSAAHIFAAFKANPKLGLVAAQGHFLEIEAFIGDNRRNLDFLLRQMGINGGDHCPYFPAGSMYWVRLEALRPLLDAGLFASSFEIEAGQIDGTLAHAVERAIGHSVAAAGLHAGEWVADRGILAPDYRGEYPYAN